MAASGHGNTSARVMVVGDCLSDEDERKGQAFFGTSGAELNKLLIKSGIGLNNCYFTNLVNARPSWGDIGKWIAWERKNIGPDFIPFRNVSAKPIVVASFHQLLREIHLVKPDIIITLGTAPLWALTGALGILKWRGSQLSVVCDRTVYPPGFLGATDQPWSGKLIPTIHPSWLARDPSQRNVVVNDLRRAAREVGRKEYTNLPEWKFIVRPSFSTASAKMGEIFSGLDSRKLEWIDFDLETRAGHIACAGLSWSTTEAISVPLMCVEDSGGYWSPEEEGQLVYLLYRILTHPNAKVRGQNLLYDAQYTYRHWHFVPRVAQDTMIAQHSVFCGLQKSLAFLASMYCNHYVFWKDDGKTWGKSTGEDQLWRYNCEDAVRTREVGEVLTRTIEAFDLKSVDDFQQRMFWPVLQCMQRGIAVDKKARTRFALKLQEEIADREAYFFRILGHTLNPSSPKQMCQLFYTDLGQKENYSRAKKGEPPHITCDDEALTKIGQREPLLRPLLKAIAEYRSLGVFLSTFVLAPLDIDSRMRTSYNICGTDTYRFSSSENAFGSGGNLQNIPKGGEDDEGGLSLPNVREIYVPDHEYTIFDTDLSKADLRIVTWESDEPEMKAMLKEGRDPYVEIAREFYHDPTITKTRPDGSDNPKYKTFKSFAHGTHYLGTPAGLAGRLGLSVHVAEKTQRWYLGRFKRIAAWQKEFCDALMSRHYVENIFGYQRHYFGRIDETTFRQAIAWLPQSTVALYINRIWMQIYEKHPHIQVMLQVHDSLVGQFPTSRKKECLAQLVQCGQIILPYPDPLIIPVGIKTSEKSWGDC